MNHADKRKLLNFLINHNAIIPNTHVVYTSGLHGSIYINKRSLYPFPHILDWIGKQFAKHFYYDGIEIVAGPAMGGIPLAYSTAAALNKKVKQKARILFAEKNKDGILEFCPEYAEMLLGQRVLIVEDIVTTGSSIKKMMELIETNRGILAGIVCLVNRGNVTPQDLGLDANFKFASLISMDLASYTAQECPLCKADIPINTSVGKGKEFLEKQAPQ